MHPQYLAARCSSFEGFEALESQDTALRGAAYLKTRDWTMLKRGCPCDMAPDALRQSGVKTPEFNDRKDRNSRCRIPSRFARFSALLPLSRPAETGRKNLSWSIPNRSRKSRSLPANTSNFSAGPGLGLVLCAARVERIGA